MAPYSKPFNSAHACSQPLNGTSGVYMYVSPKLCWRKFFFHKSRVLSVISNILLFLCTKSVFLTFSPVLCIFCYRALKGVISLFGNN